VSSRVVYRSHDPATYTFPAVVSPNVIMVFSGDKRREDHSVLPISCSIFRKSRFLCPWLPSTTWGYRSLLKDRSLLCSPVSPRSLKAPQNASLKKFGNLFRDYNVIRQGSMRHIKRIRAIRAKEKYANIKALVLTTNSALYVPYQADRLTTRCRTQPEAAPQSQCHLSLADAPTSRLGHK
jgi:hypothetical protein